MQALDEISSNILKELNVFNSENPLSINDHDADNDNNNKSPNKHLSLRIFEKLLLLDIEEPTKQEQEQTTSNDNIPT